tara:strand:+ start:684 stop:1001 length:318 start_codon:yes stop_codon:yes gene_type:complete
MRLRFEEWLLRKGLTCQKIVESGVKNEVELLAMADRLGVIPPTNMEEYQAIWEAEAQPKGNAVAKKKPATQTSDENSKTKVSKTGSKTARRRSTRKKTNIKDDEK